MNRDDIFAAVAAERDRQHHLWDRAHEHGWGDCSSPHVNIMTKVAVLGEEFGEVARAALECDMRGMETELVQLIAVAVAILEGIHHV